MEYMKTYKAILLAVGGLIIIVGGAYYFTEGARFQKPVDQVKVKENTSVVNGQVVRTFEGENKAVYSFDIPDTATTTTSMDGALVRIDEAKALFAAVYFSYEGGRGYGAEEYINRIVAPQVKALTVGATSTVGSYMWMHAENANTEWHVAQVGDGQWLMVVENPKSNHDRVVSMLEDVEVK